MPLKEISRTAPDLTGYIPETRAFCRRGENTSQDELIGQLLNGALIKSERMIGGPLAVTEYSYYIDNQPALILLPYSQLIQVDGVFVLMDDETEIEQVDTWTTDTWRLMLKNNQEWDVSDKKISMMRIDFTAGFETLPDEVIEAMKRIVKWDLDNDTTDYPEVLKKEINTFLAKFKRLA